MVKEPKEFGIAVYGYDPLLSKEEIESFKVNALNFLLAQVFFFEKKKCVEVYGYDPLHYKEKIEEFGVNALNEVNEKMDCVIITTAHDEFKHKAFLKKKAFSERNISSFSQGFLFREKVVNEKPLLVDARGMFDEEEAEIVLS